MSLTVRQESTVDSGRMTIAGTVDKTAILLGLALVTAMWPDVVFPAQPQ